MRIDHKAAGAGSVAGAHGSTMATGKGQPGCDGAGRWGETHHLPRSSRMAQSQVILASFVPSLPVARDAQLLRPRSDQMMRAAVAPRPPVAESDGRDWAPASGSSLSPATGPPWRRRRRWARHVRRRLRGQLGLAGHVELLRLAPRGHDHRPGGITPRPGHDPLPGPR
jgi:hypothetical protein